MAEKKSVDSPSTHPLVRELLAAGEGKALAIGGYVGPAAAGRVRLYADLGLRIYIELAKQDVVRIVDSTEVPQGPSVVYFKRDVENICIHLLSTGLAKRTVSRISRKASLKETNWPHSRINDNTSSQAPYRTINRYGRWRITRNCRNRPVPKL